MALSCKQWAVPSAPIGAVCVVDAKTRPLGAVPSMQPRLATGADGERYLLADSNAVQWRVAGGQAEIVNAITWELGSFSVIPY